MSIEELINQLQDIRDSGFIISDIVLNDADTGWYLRLHSVSIVDKYLVLSSNEYCDIVRDKIK